VVFVLFRDDLWIVFSRLKNNDPRNHTKQHEAHCRLTKKKN